jgi:hypothetical protein
MEVVEWTNCEDKREDSFGSLSGFFENGMRWKDYVERFTDEGRVRAEALRRGIIAKGIRRGGFWHQCQSGNDDGVPVFSDNTVANFSMRAWGDLLAAVWSQEEDTDYNYCQFAWYTAEEDADFERETPSPGDSNG